MMSSLYNESILNPPASNSDNAASHETVGSYDTHDEPSDLIASPDKEPDRVQEV